MRTNVSLIKNHLPEFADYCKRFGADLVAETANDIEAEVASKWASFQLPINSATSGAGRKMTALVKAGSRRRFYAGFLEWGTIDQAPRPAMTQAAENARPKFLSAAAAISRGFRP